MPRSAPLPSRLIPIFPYLALFLLPCLLLPFFLPILTFPASLPAALLSNSRALTPPCSPPSLRLHDSGFCIGGCHSHCFPRIRGLCFSSSQVKVCSETNYGKPIERLMTSHFVRYNENYEEQAEVPTIMRFYGERLTLPVQFSRCTGAQHWYTGLSMVADQRFLPYRKPNPHHEAEKIIPALLMSRVYGLSNITLYWFSSSQELSAWAKGFLKATGMEDRVKYLNLPRERGSEICFDDAVVFSGPTNLWYIPDQSTNNWLRECALQYCSISHSNASWPVKSASILDRISRPRQLANKQKVAEVVSQVFNIPVKEKFSGVGSFCDQVKVVVEDDIVIVPHGSQNVNLIFARPGTTVIEVFPYLFYTNALWNYTHAAQLRLYPLLGIRPPNNKVMWFFSFLGWDFCYNNFRWCKNFSRQQLIYADVKELERLLLRIHSDGRA